MDQAEVLDSRDDPRLAFLFRLHASEVGIAKLRDVPDQRGQEWLLDLVNQLEKMKPSLQGNPAAREEEKERLESEARRLLRIAEENKNKHGDALDAEARVSVAKGFHLASLYFETLAVFGPASEEVRKATLHCKVTLRNLLRAAKQELSVKSAGSDGEQTPKMEPQSRVTSDREVPYGDLVENNTIFRLAEKEAKHAISAIQFEDAETAAKHLGNALEALQKLRKKL